MLQPEINTNAVSQSPSADELVLPGLTPIAKSVALGLSTKTPTVATMLQDLSELTEVAAVWEVESYQTSNVGLHEILARCYQIHSVLSVDGAKALRNQFKAYLEANKAVLGSFKSTTPLLQRIVRVAFPEASAQRVSIYSKALKAAFVRKQSHTEIASFFIKAGGVEAAAANVTLEAEIAQKANAQAQVAAAAEVGIKVAKPIVTVTAPALAFVKPPEGEPDQEHFVFIGERVSSDTFAIVGVVANTALVKAAKEKWYAENKKAIDDAAASVKAVSQQDAMAEAIKNVGKVAVKAEESAQAANVGGTQVVEGELV